MLQHQTPGRGAGPGAGHRVGAHLLRAAVVEGEPAAERTLHGLGSHADHGVKGRVAADGTAQLPQRGTLTAYPGCQTDRVEVRQVIPDKVIRSLHKIATYQDGCIEEYNTSYEYITLKSGINVLVS